MNPIHQCGHCGVEGEHQGLQVKTLTYFADFEDLYCKHCIKKAIGINESCDGCKTLGPDLFTMRDGVYCESCRFKLIRGEAPC